MSADPQTTRLGSDLFIGGQCKRGAAGSLENIDPGNGETLRVFPCFFKGYLTKLTISFAIPRKHGQAPCRIRDDRRRTYEGGTVLLIGTTENVPELVRLLSGRKLPASSTDDFDTMFIVSIPTFGNSSVLSLKY